MYRAFNLNLTGLFLPQTTSAFETKAAAQQQACAATLEGFLQENGRLDGDALSQAWFPQEEAHIFISHSHRDRRLAQRLAAWLEQNFGITSFIDSSVWQNSARLLKLVDDLFCRSSGGRYGYARRNRSTAHVHLMLSTALTKMMDATECVFFLNTPNSISSQNAVETTQSPWLFHEIAATHLLRRKSPAEHRPYLENFAAIKKQDKTAEMMDHLVDLSEMAVVSDDCLKEWRLAYVGKRQFRHNTSPPSPFKALDELYALANPAK